MFTMACQQVGYTLWVWPGVEAFASRARKLGVLGGGPELADTWAKGVGVFNPNG